MIKSGEVKSPWSARVTLAAVDTTVPVKVTPGAGRTLVVTRWTYFSVTSAAQIITVSDGVTPIGNIPASVTAGNKHDFASDVGVRLTVNSPLVIAPAAAGPAGYFLAEGYID